MSICRVAFAREGMLTLCKKRASPPKCRSLPPVLGAGDNTSATVALSALSFSVIV